MWPVFHSPTSGHLKQVWLYFDWYIDNIDWCFVFYLGLWPWHPCLLWWLDKMCEGRQPVTGGPGAMSPQSQGQSGSFINSMKCVSTWEVLSVLVLISQVTVQVRIQVLELSVLFSRFFNFVTLKLTMSFCSVSRPFTNAFFSDLVGIIVILNVN